MAASDLNTLYNTLVAKVYQDDIESQQYYLSFITEMRNIPVEYLIQRGVLFIPNNEYIRHYIGADADSYNGGLYYGQTCAWTLFYTIPILDLVGEVAGLVGWDLENKRKAVEEDQLGLPMYKVSPKAIFPRERYFLTDVDLLKKTFDKRVIFVVDGVFDSMALNARGIPAIALLGSTVSPEVLYFLGWYKFVYVVRDNDAAGKSLYYKLKNSLQTNVFSVLQGKTKDIEELLRTDPYSNGPITKQFLALLENPERSDIRLKV